MLTSPSHPTWSNCFGPDLAHTDTHAPWNDGTWSVHSCLPRSGTQVNHCNINQMCLETVFSAIWAIFIIYYFSHFRFTACESILLSQYWPLLETPLQCTHCVAVIVKVKVCEEIDSGKHTQRLEPDKRSRSTIQRHKTVSILYISTVTSHV